MVSWTTDRARVAGLSRSRALDDPDLVEARRQLKAKRLVEHVAREVSAAPTLTPDQLAAVAAVLPGGGE